MKAQHSHTKLPWQRLMLRQVKWGVRYGPITINGLLPPTTSFFHKFNLSIRISYR